MAIVNIPLVLELPPPLKTMSLALGKDQKVATKKAAKTLQSLVSRHFSGAELGALTFTCPNGNVLPDLTAAEYVQQIGHIVVSSADGPFQQLLDQVGTLRTEVQAQRTEIDTLNARNTRLESQVGQHSADINELRQGRPQLEGDQQKYFKILQRDIVVRARDFLSAEGNKPDSQNFYDFSQTMSKEFLDARNLSWDNINFINGKTILHGDRVAHGSTLDQLQRSLDGLTEDKLKHLEPLFNYVRGRHQQQQQQQQQRRQQQQRQQRQQQEQELQQ